MVWAEGSKRSVFQYFIVRPAASCFLLLCLCVSCTINAKSEGLSSYKRRLASGLQRNRSGCSLQASERENSPPGPTRHGQSIHKERGGPLPVKKQASTRIIWIKKRRASYRAGSDLTDASVRLRSRAVFDDHPPL